VEEEEEPRRVSTMIGLEGDGWRVLLSSGCVVRFGEREREREREREMTKGMIESRKWINVIY
jgi:hypothetical protein